MKKRNVLFISVIYLFITSCSFAIDTKTTVNMRMESSFIARDLSLGLKSFEKNGKTYDVRGSEHNGFTQTFLSISTKLSQKVSTEIEFLYENIWKHISNSHTVSLELGYIMLKDFMFDGITLQIGRQDLRFGRGFIIGDPDTNNQSTGDLTYYAPDITWHKSFNGAKVTGNYNDFTADVLYAESSLPTKGDARRDDQIYGINIKYSFSENALAETYFWIYNHNETQSSNTLTEDYFIKIGGIRTENNLFNNILVYTEAACQWGEGTAHVFNKTVNYTKVAGQAGIEYYFQNKFNSEIHAECTYLPGTSNINKLNLSSWNPVFEDQTPGEIGNIIFPQSNLFYLKIGGSSNLIYKLNLGFDFYYFRLAQKSFDIPLRGNSSMLFLDNGGGYYRYSDNPGKKDLGWEIDAFMKYDYSEDFQIRFTTAFFVPSNVFNANNNNLAYSVKLSGKISF